MQQFWGDVMFYANLTFGSIVACYAIAVILLAVGVVETIKSRRKHEKFQLFTGAAYTGSFLISGFATAFVCELMK